MAIDVSKAIFLPLKSERDCSFKAAGAKSFKSLVSCLMLRMKGECVGKAQSQGVRHVLLPSQTGEAAAQR